MKKSTVLLFFIYTLLLSCGRDSDDNEYIINGVVIDWDSKTPIAGAKVYAGRRLYNVSSFDSTVSDAGGRYSFKYMDNVFRPTYPAKDGYQNPFVVIPLYWYMDFDRIDTLYLAKSSYLNVAIHRVGSYSIADSMEMFFGKYSPVSPIETNLLNSSFYQGKRRAANAPDTLINATAVYSSAPGNKIFFYWNIIRNGSIISSHSDSTDLIQYGIKNYTVNY